MNESTQRLINALREELQQYGEMLALLDKQQDLVVRRDSSAILNNLAMINGQASVIQVARRERELRQQELNTSLRLFTNATFAELIRRLPPELQPLMQALMDEINQCLRRVQHRARQNHLLLSRSLEMLQQFIATLFPSHMVTTYNQAGRVSGGILTSGGLCEVAG
jgi:flagellar biosynthesis/type III secretory pathway chaperone